MGFLRRRTTTTTADKLSEFIVTTAEYGASVPEVLGTTRMSGNVIYYDDFTAHEHRDVQRAGKGGGSKHVNITYTYTVATILGLCEGKIDGIGRVWIGKNVYNYPSDEIQLTLFDGNAEQKPWAYTLGKHPDKALPYSGLAYMAGVVDLGEQGTLPNYNFEVKGKLLNTGDGVDVNPADYIRFILDKAGLKDVEIKGLDNYRNYCKEADFLISTPPDSRARKARDIVNDIAKLTNAYIFWSNDSFKIVPLEDRQVGAWEPNKKITFDLTEDDFLPQGGGALLQYERKDSSELYNSFPVEFINRKNNYEKESVSYQFTDDIKKHGVRSAPTVRADFIYKKERAVKLAEAMARINKYRRNRYTFKLDWAFCQLEIGDLVTLSDKNIGIDKQVAVINSVVESYDGTLTFTALSMPKGNYTSAEFKVNETDRPCVDFNKPADNTEIVIVQPPSDITDSGREIWIGGYSKGSNWGGAEVLISDDGERYKTVGQIANSVRCGKLKKAIKAEDTEIVVSCNAPLLGGSRQDAERKNTLCWLDGECFSYEKSELQQDGTYKLSGCIRGQLNTKVVGHGEGSSFARLDSNFLKIGYRKEDIGKKIYIKAPAMNIFGSGLQDLSDLKAFEYTLTDYYIPNVTNVRAYNRYRQTQNGSNKYDIVVSWDEPDMETYESADVWYKTQSGKRKNGDFSDTWIYGGSGIKEVVIPQAVIGDTYLMAVCTKDRFGKAASPDVAPKVKILVALKTTIPTTPTNAKLTFDKVITLSWDEVTNADIAYYEVRTNDKCGNDYNGLLGRTSELSLNLILKEREGTIYLFAKSATDKYSSPAIVEYNKETPQAPKLPILKNIIGGMLIKAQETIPQGCVGLAVDINGEVYKTENSSYTHMCDAGIHDVSIAWVDIFGVGTYSASARTDVKITIPTELIDTEALGIDKINATLNGIDDRIDKGVEKAYESKVGDVIDEVKSQVVQLSDVITQKVESKVSKLESQITQIDNGIDLRIAKKADKDKIISQINLSESGTKIDGRLLHVTGDTKFDKNVIVGGALQAGSVSADKLKVDSLSAISASLGKMESGLIRGVRYESQNGKAWIQDDEIHGMKISADVFEQAGYKIKNLDIIHVRTIPFQKIKYPDGVKPEDCVVMRTAYGDKFFESKEKGHWLAQEYCKKIGVTALVPDSSSIVLTKECVYYVDLFKKIIVDAVPPSGRGLSVSADIDVTREGVAYAYKSKYMVARRNKDSDYSSAWIEFYYVEIDLLVIRR
jgi:hypothetical protein|nr:MAG TPA: tail protein [Caudoviricetes sp.]